MLARFCTAWVPPARCSAEVASVVAALRRMPEVGRVWSTNGRWDLLAELRADTMADLSQVLERIRLIKGIANTETSILLATYADARA